MVTNGCCLALIQSPQDTAAATAAAAAVRSPSRRCCWCCCCCCLVAFQLQVFPAGHCDAAARHVNDIHSADVHLPHQKITSNVTSRARSNHACVQGSIPNHLQLDNNTD
jgi:hypothetical protein